MTIFKEKKEIPSEISVTRNRKIKIMLSYIRQFWIDDISYTHSLYGSDFQNRRSFIEFFYQNLKKVTKIVIIKNLVTKTLYLRNGILHNIHGAALIIRDTSNTKKKYFIDGRHYTEANFYKKIRSYKLYKVLFNIENS